MSDAQFTQRPAAAGYQGDLEALVYVRQSCTVHPLPACGVVTIGRADGNEIRIDDQSVSRRHLALHIGFAIEVEDLESANGSLIIHNEEDGVQDGPTRRNEAEARGKPGERRPLMPGDLLRIGVALVVVQSRRPSSRVRRAVSIAPADSPVVLLDPEMKRAYEIALNAARSNISVLITGETGSGKEVLAETIHLKSHRKGKPFLRLNCAAFSETLLESELFGYERRAFTGATQAKAGLLESNNEGTVFLDEIGEMSLTTQAKVLRVLEERAILRIGATKARPIDVRFVCATNRDLQAQARLGRFRNDLYYRIAGVEFAIPPLRRRPLELEPLARLFLKRFCERSALALPVLTDEAISAMHRYSWPGNVRELKNVMERAPFVCEGGPILAKHIPSDESPDENGLFPPEEAEATELFVPRVPIAGDLRLQRNQHPSGLGTESPDERDRVLRAVEQCAGNQTRAAKLLGMSRGTLIKRLEKLSLPRPKKS